MYQNTATTPLTYAASFPAQPAHLRVLLRTVMGRGAGGSVGGSLGAPPQHRAAPTAPSSQGGLHPCWVQAVASAGWQRCPWRAWHRPAEKGSPRVWLLLEKLLVIWWEG